MASNFGMVIDKNGRGLYLKLTGDFDGSSACEVIEVLRQCPDDIPRIFIQTNGLKTVFPFGRDLFRKLLYLVDGRTSRVFFTGDKASRLSLGN